MNKTIILEIEEKIIIGNSAEVMGSPVWSGDGPRVGIVKSIKKTDTFDTDGRDAEAIELTVLLNKEAIFCKRGIDRISAEASDCKFNRNFERMESQTAPVFSVKPPELLVDTKEFLELKEINRNLQLIIGQLDEQSIYQKERG